MEVQQRQRLGLTLLLGALVLLQWLPLQSLHELLSGGAARQGPLTALRSEPRSDQPDCRSDDCVVNTAPPAISRRQPLQAVRYLQVPTKPLLPPSGEVFVSEDLSGQAWLARYERMPGRYRTGFVHRPATVNPNGPSSTPLDLAEMGYVRQARLAGSAVRLGIDGHLRGADGQLQGGVASRAAEFAELQFQPLPRAMFVEWPGAAARLPDLGTRVRLHALLGQEEANDMDGPMPADAIEARVIEQQAYLNPPRLLLEFNAGGLVAWLSHRVQREIDGEGPAFPDTMGLQWNTDGATSTPVVSVGTRALVTDAQGLRAWAVIDDRAIPITVRELRRRGEQVTIVEQPGALGLPVRQADWALLDTAARAAVLKWATQPNGDRQEMLRAELPLIQLPPARLQPGQRVRRQS